MGSLSYFPLSALPCSQPFAFFFSVLSGIYFPFMPPFAAGGGGRGCTFVSIIFFPEMPSFAGVAAEGAAGFGFVRRGGGLFGCPVFLFGYGFLQGL
ncbi:MAG: hypothetical protein A2W17_06230 [Planctomycetes bacterium RBG_16_41_13]|nr:MAG: hypothetical protein A2W17_06230 [Planctomycetes bacterium RBG_16_41_13]